MDMQLKQTLTLLGLSEKEIRFFLASFALGPATISEIIKKAKLERATGYLIYKELLEKGFLEEDFREYRKTIILAEPKKLLRMLSNKQRVIRRQEMQFAENLPDLQSLYLASEVRPKVRVFDGNKGLLSVWEDILSSKSEILLWSNQETESKFFTKEFHDKFIQERIRKNIFVKVQAVDNKEGRTLIKNDKNSLRETKLLPKTVIFSAETYIYDNKIAILDYKKDIIGIIIESEPIAAAQRAIFEMNWI